MGKMVTAVFKGTEYTLSFVEWESARKLQYASFKKLGAINDYEHPNFVPACEIAIYDVGPDDLLSHPAKLNKPSLIFYYRSLALAEEKMGHIEELLKEGGDCGKPMREYIDKAGDQLDEFAWMPPVSQFLDDITEEWGG